MGVACVEAATAGAAVVDAARCMPNRVSVETARASAIATTTTVRFMVKPPATRGMAADTLPNASPGDDRTSCKLAARDHGGDRALARLRQVEPGSVVPVRAPPGGSGRSRARRTLHMLAHQTPGHRVSTFTLGTHGPSVELTSEEHDAG